ncbi:MAG: PilZ domain-containing protein, partial [Bacillota bacterium]
EISDDIVSIKVTKEFAEANFLEGDPAVLGIERNNEIYLTNCYVVTVVAHKGIIKLGINNEEFIVNKRAHERYPVSLYADIKKKDADCEFVSIVKNISFNGIMVCTKKDLFEGELLDARIYFEGSNLSLGAKIMWKIQRSTDYEYGMKITYMDYVSQTVLNRYIEKLKEEQEE